MYRKLVLEIRAAFDLPMEDVMKIINSDLLNQLKLYKRPLLLAFGGLRYEKGIDLLLASLTHMEQEATLIVAGPESNFKKSDLLDIIERISWGRAVRLQKV
jgi:hypothetical protein